MQQEFPGTPTKRPVTEFPSEKRLGTKHLAMKGCVQFHHLHNKCDYKTVKLNTFSERL